MGSLKNSVWMIGLMCTAEACAGANVVRNASFELDRQWNGTFMRQGSEFYQAHAQQNGQMQWMPTSAEAWWWEGWYGDTWGTGSADIVDDAQHTGRRSLKVQGPKVVISAFDRVVPKGRYTLSAWVKTAGAKGRFELEFNDGWRSIHSNGGRQYRTGVELPEQTEWTRLAVSGDFVEDNLEAMLRLTVRAGTVWLDDVQIEAGNQASEFNLRPEERIRLEIGEDGWAELPKWQEGDPAVRKILVFNDSRVPLKGKVSVFVGPWNKPADRKLGEFEAAELGPGEPKLLTLTTEELRPDAYVAIAKLEDGGTVVLDGEKVFNPKEPSGGTVSNSMMSSRLVCRYVIASKTPPGRIFGVANGMLSWGGSWFSGYNLTDYTEARELGVVCSRGPDNDDACFLTAVAGIPIHATSPFFDQEPPDASCANPADLGYIDVYSPAGYEALMRRAEQIAKRFAANPVVVSYQMANERPYINSGSLCPSVHADASFRDWCRKRHGDLRTLNARWKTSYTDWAQVEQIVSAKLLDEEKNRPKLQGSAAIDWTAAARTFSDPVLKRMQENPGRAMDWLRWRSGSSVATYAAFREQAKKFAPKTLYSTNLCWPNLWPQIAMPFFRAMDVTMLDFQYTAGWPKSLGTPQEMIDIAEMCESAAPTKPLWGIEVYVQPSWPGAFAGMQNWAMVAHGMTNNLVFGWKPYSDAGPVQGPRAWEKPDAPPMWFMIDTDGARLPAYESYRRTIREIADYHRQFDGLSFQRVRTSVALYVSPDTAEYVVYETGNKPWGSCWTRTRINLVYLLRMNGITADYVDDETLPDTPGKFGKLIVPAAYVLNQQAAAKIARFAKQGGTVILAGASGVADPWLNRYANLGGPAWAELNWQAPNFTTDFVAAQFDKDMVLGTDTQPTAAERAGTVGGPIGTGVNEARTFRGASIGAVAEAEAIRDVRGTVVGWKRPWGKGRLIAYGVFPDTYVTNPHPSLNMTHWVRSVIADAGLQCTGRWVGDAKPSTTGNLGTGNPVVEVVVREKSREKLVFCFNQGGEGSGVVEVPVWAGGMWKAKDVVTGKPVVGDVKNMIWRLPLTLKPWEYRVTHLSRVGALAK